MSRYTSTNERDITVSGKTKRIAAFDIIRGLMLLIILIGHIELPPNIFDIFTGRGRLFVSAAEGFFFLSGLLVGMVYRRRIAHGFKFIFKRMWGRAFELYLASVFFTLLYTFIAFKTNHLSIKPGVPTPIDWQHIISQTLLLRFEWGWADFLGRFAILMLLAPFVFYLLAKGRWKIVLVLIFLGWFLRGQNFTLGWQVIFNGGMIVGYFWKELHRYGKNLKPATRKYAKRTIVWISAVTFAFSYASVYILPTLNTKFNSLPTVWQSFTQYWDRLINFLFIYADKWTMGPIRIVLFVLWGIVLYTLISKHDEKINKISHGLLTKLGQNSLFVYIYHSIIVFVFKFFIPAETNFFQNTIIVALAIALLLGGLTIYTGIRSSNGDRAKKIIHKNIKKIRVSFNQKQGSTL